MSIEQTHERPNIAHLLRLGSEVPNGVMQRKGIQYLSLPAQGLQDDQKA